MSIIRSVVNGIGNMFDLFFDEPEVARYVTIDQTLGGIKVPDPSLGGSSDVEFLRVRAPGLINGSIPVLFFRTKHSGEPRISILLNSTRLLAYTFANDDPHHSWHIFIPSGALRTQSNILAFSATGGEDDYVIFSDVFILYKSNKLTVRRPILPSQT